MPSVCFGSSNALRFVRSTFFLLKRFGASANIFWCGRGQSLRLLLVAINQSIPPMLNAFALVALLTAIYSIMAVTFFSSMMPELFGDFVSSSFTMFQIMTGDQWGDIARELFVLTGKGTAVAFFFVSYQLVVAFVLVNVVIAVLLEEFSKAAADEKESGSKSLLLQRRAGTDAAERCVLDRLVAPLKVVGDVEEFEKRVQGLYIRLTQLAELPDGERSRMNCHQFKGALQTIGLIPPILFTDADWDQLVVNVGLLNMAGTMGYMEFGILIRQAFRRHQVHILDIFHSCHAIVHAIVSYCLLIEGSLRS